MLISLLAPWPAFDTSWKSSRRYGLCCRRLKMVLVFHVCEDRGRGADPSHVVSYMHHVTCAQAHEANDAEALSRLSLAIQDLGQVRAWDCAACASYILLG